MRESDFLTALLAEREARRAQDPLWGFKPHPKQQAFIDAVLGPTCYENWLFAANRAGKSDAGAWAVAHIARFGFPHEPSFRPTIGWVVSLDFPSSRDIVQPKLFDNGVSGQQSHPPFIPDREIKTWRVSDQVLVLKNGSVIGFKSADSGRAKFQGAERDYVWFDEEPPLEVYEETVMRVPAGRRLKILGTCTLLPQSGHGSGVSWAFDRLIKPWKDGTAGHQIFTASIYDNPWLSTEEVRRLEAMYPPGSLVRRIRLDGELIAGLSGSRVYSAFDRSIHVSDDLQLSPHLPICWAWDFNVAPMVSVIGQYQHGKFVVLRECVMEQGSITEMVEWVRDLYPAHPAGIWIYGDATGQSRTAQTGASDYAMIMQGMRSYPSAVRLKIPSTNPLIRDRINAVNRALVDENGTVGVKIDRKQCPELIKDLEEVVYDARGRIKKTTDPKDPYTKRTHVSDAFGYWVVATAPVAPWIHSSGVWRAQPVTIPKPRYAFTS